MHYAAVYFSALAGLGTAPATPHTATDQRQIGQNSSEILRRRGTSELTQDGRASISLLPARLRLDDGGEAADPNHGQRKLPQTEGVKVPLRTSGREADAAEADAPDAAAPQDITPSATWGVSGAGEIVASLPPPSQLYTSRRTSDRQVPAIGTGGSTAETTPAAVSDSAAVSAASSEPAPGQPAAWQDDTPAHFAAGVDDAVAAAGADGMTPAAAAAGDGGSGGGSSIVARDKQEAALIAMAERASVLTFPPGAKTSPDAPEPRRPGDASAGDQTMLTNSQCLTYVHCAHRAVCRGRRGQQRHPGPQGISKCDAQHRAGAVHSVSASSD